MTVLLQPVYEAAVRKTVFALAWENLLLRNNPLPWQFPDNKFVNAYSKKVNQGSPGMLHRWGSLCCLAITSEFCWTRRRRRVRAAATCSLNFSFLNAQLFVRKETEELRRFLSVL
eukprot:COSAG06_NODE_15642_length_1055_cov_2.922594_2_plen_114_part_01